MGLFSFLFGSCSKPKPPDTGNGQAVFTNLRKRALTGTRAAFGLDAPATPTTPWGVMVKPVSRRVHILSSHSPMATRAFISAAAVALSVELATRLSAERLRRWSLWPRNSSRKQRQQRSLHCPKTGRRSFTCSPTPALSRPTCLSKIWVKGVTLGLRYSTLGTTSSGSIGLLKHANDRNA